MLGTKETARGLYILDLPLAARGTESQFVAVFPDGPGQSAEGLALAWQGPLLQIKRTEIRKIMSSIEVGGNRYL
jgi:hypothetical protein